MALSTKGKLNYRCPSCFNRDIDMDMFYDEERQEYYCLRCGFVGDLEKVLHFNEKIKEKYGYLQKRVTSFNEDNEPLSVEQYSEEKQWN